MAGKKKKYNARFPPARIKKIMQTDDEVGKIAAAVPVVISRALELFLESIITESVAKANECHAKTLSSSHIKSVIQSKPAFDFLKTQVTLVPDLTSSGAETTHSIEKSQSAASKPATAVSPSAPSLAAETSTAADTAQQAPKKRARISTSCPQEPDAADAQKPKKKRGRPPKIKPAENSTAVGLPAVAPEVAPINTPAPLPSPQLPANGEPKQEVKEPVVMATPIATPPSPVKSAEAAVKPEVKVEAVDRECSRESIFTTNTTLGLPALAKSDLQRQAHATNVGFNSFYRPGHAVNLSSAPSQTLHEGLSPTSQPIDLSNKFDTPTRRIGPPPPSSQLYNGGVYAISTNAAGLPAAHTQSYSARDV